MVQRGLLPCEAIADGLDGELRRQILRWTCSLNAPGSLRNLNSCLFQPSPVFLLLFVYTVSLMKRLYQCSLFFHCNSSFLLEFLQLIWISPTSLVQIPQSYSQQHFTLWIIDQGFIWGWGEPLILKFSGNVSVHRIIAMVTKTDSQQGESTNAYLIHSCTVSWQRAM